MSKLPIVKELEATQLKTSIPEFRVGDTLRVDFRIIEKKKDEGVKRPGQVKKEEYIERLQSFTGTVIARKGSGLSETVTLYRVAFGGSIERVFLLHSPRVATIERISLGRVRRAKLYYLLGKMGKKAKVRQKLGVRPSPVKKGNPSSKEVQTPAQVSS